LRRVVTIAWDLNVPANPMDEALYRKRSERQILRSELRREPQSID
jgi:hypothetical protein